MENDAKLASPFTAKRQLSKEGGKKGSQKVLVWDASEVQAINDLKAALGRALSFHQIQVDKPFIFRMDASGYAIGAVLEQERDGQIVQSASAVGN